MKTFKEKRFSEALKRQVIDHAKLYSVKSAGQVFGLGDSSLRSILKANSFPCNLCKRKCAYRGQLQRHMLEVHKVEQSIKVEEKKIIKRRHRLRHFGFKLHFSGSRSLSLKLVNECGQ